MLVYSLVRILHTVVSMSFASCVWIVLVVCVVRNDNLKMCVYVCVCKASNSELPFLVAVTLLEVDSPIEYLEKVGHSSPYSHWKRWESTDLIELDFYSQCH